MTMEKMLEVDSDYWRGYVELEGDTLYPRIEMMSPMTPEIFTPIIRDIGLTPSSRKDSRPRPMRLNQDETIKQFFNSCMLE